MSPRQKRRALVSVGLSLLLHLLALILYLRVMDWQRHQQLRPTRYLPDLLLLVPQAFRSTSVTAPTVAMEREPTPAEVAELEQDLAALQTPEGIGAISVPGSSLSGDLEPGGRAITFKPVFTDLDTVDIEQRQIDAVARLRDLYGSYSRVWLPDVDTTDQQSKLESRARAIVADALEAMGGTERVLKIHSMKALVWIVASEHVSGPRTIGVSPYAYPVGTWSYSDETGARWERTPFTIDFMQAPLPDYASKMPGRSRWRALRHWDTRWYVNTPPDTRKFRERSEGVYWHLAHRFLNEGVRLQYAGSGTLRDRPVHTVRVVDSKFGREYDAFFDKETSLLVGTYEELTEFEKEWFRQQRQGRRSRPPTWWTYFDRYDEIDGVRFPQRILRQVGGGMPSEILLNITFNGAEPDSTAPEP